MVSRSEEIFLHNTQSIAGGVVSLNRLVKPHIAFQRARGAYVWDADGQAYIDYHAAFAAHILGHNDPAVNAAVMAALEEDQSLFGSGTTEAEGTLADLVVQCLSSVEQVQMTNAGSESTYHAIRIARAHTGREHIIVMQAGYNGWHNDVAVNLMTPLRDLGPRVSPGEYRVMPLSAGIPTGVLDRVHVVNFNDAASVEYVMRRYPVAAILLEPVLQNIGVVPPAPGYLEDLRRLCDRYGALLIFDEVKTGFRAAIGGYQSIVKVRPDLTLLGKAVANGYPLSIVGGPRTLMQYFHHPDISRRVLIAGTYNAHPVSMAAGIATLRKLTTDKDLYPRMVGLADTLRLGLLEIAGKMGVVLSVSQVGSALGLYFMDHVPNDWHDLAEHHDFTYDELFRRALIRRGIYLFPLATKQISVSAAHTKDDIHQTLEHVETVLGETYEQHRKGSG